MIIHESKLITFTETDHEVWRQTIKLKKQFLNKYSKFIYEPYFDGYNKLGFDSSDRLPTLEEINEKLFQIGWEAIFVDGYLPPKIYAGLILKKKVPISYKVRPYDQIDYALEPDLIHDMIGHLPMLFFGDYTEYLMDISKCFIAAKQDELDLEITEAEERLSIIKNSNNKNDISILENKIHTLMDMRSKNPSPLYQLGKLFLWTIEFGLLGNTDLPKLYGAGLMSSVLESEAICQGKINLFPLTIDLVTKPFHYSKLQEQVFVAKNFKELSKILRSFKS